ncbi:hypothetical protein BY458DRAFT_585631 [Sporodiniella umbellata]|nr:hypothetical protein BY458DRAFT_585631 [Sporodiniella umbellata]
MTQISKDEAAIYDRQIRLWGLDAQQRIGNASVLIANIRALSNEVCKNLVLAGIGSLTIIDHETVSEFDLGAQFLLSQNDIGKNRAEAVSHNIRLLNPRVEVIVDKDDVSAKPDSYFEKFSVVCLVHSDYKFMHRIDNIRRCVKKPFYASDAFGWFGYIFCDLMDHTYVQEKKTNDGTEKTTHNEQYLSLEKSLLKNWSSMTLKTLKKRISPMAYVIYVLFMFQRENGHFPSEEEVETIIDQRDTYFEKMGITHSDLLQTSLFRQVCSLYKTEIAPVAAIVGGILSQDILRTLSANDLPIKNWLYYNALDETGMVHDL